MEDGHFKSVGYVHGGILSSLRLPLFSLPLKLGRLFSALFMPKFSFQEVAIRRLCFGHAHSLVTGNWTAKHFEYVARSDYVIDFMMAFSLRLHREDRETGRVFCTSTLNDVCLARGCLIRMACASLGLPDLVVRLVM
jgi:hypothetical protein